jgi:hypothetical protein
VVVHAGHAPVGTVHTGPVPFGRVLARHPGLAAVVAHLGAPDYLDFLDLAEKYDRVALDTTMAFTPFFEQFVPFPTEALPRLSGAGRQGAAGQRLPEPSLPVRRPARRVGPAGPGRRLAAGGLLGERRGAVRADLTAIRAGGRRASRCYSTSAPHLRCGHIEDAARLKRVSGAAAREPARPVTRCPYRSAGSRGRSARSHPTASRPR